MENIIHDVAQGSREWLALRAEFNTASEAPAMLGLSKYQTRNELLAQKFSGVSKEVSAQQQALFDRGHATEEQARTILEARLGEDLYPATLSLGKLLASMDGMDMAGTVLFEHKLLNQSLVKQIEAGELEPHYWAQLEQQLHVSGAEMAYFVCSDGTEDNFHVLEYRPVPGRIEKILAGWEQFQKDLATYVPPVERQETLAATIERFPALAVQLVGEVRQSNLPVVKASILDLIKSVNTELTTDQHFADAEATVKFFDKAEKELEVVKCQALSQTASIAELFDTIAHLQGEMRNKRLFIDKLVKARKETIRTEIRQAREKAFAAHVADINKQIGPRVTLPLIPTDFAGVMKGKRTIASLEDAVDSELARAKIEADTLARKISINVEHLRTLDGKYRGLFSDAQQLVTKDAEDFQNLAAARCAQFDRDEEARLEKERERIRQEEEKKAREALAQQVREQEEAERREDAANAAQLAKATPAAAEPTVQTTPVARLHPAQEAAPQQNPHYHTGGIAKVASRIPARFTLVNMDALIKDIASGAMPMDLIQIQPDAVADYIAENGCAPTGFTLSGGQDV